jgi:hypothetical protein
MLSSLHHDNADTLTTLIPHVLTRKIILCVDIVVALEFPLFNANELDNTKGCRNFENVAVKSSSRHYFLEDLAECEIKCYSVCMYVGSLLLAVQ